MTPYACTIRLADTDAAGRIYFAAACRIAHEAFEAFMAAAGLGLDRLISERNWGLPVVRAEADFRREIRLGAHVIVSTEIITAGTSSITFRHTLTLEDGLPAATVNLTHAAISGETGRAIPLPPALRALVPPTASGTSAT